jgi:hypothetical protein
VISSVLSPAFIGLSGVPQLSVFGSPSPRVPVVIVVGGLPEDSQIIGPFAAPALATRFARRQCHSDYTIAPLHRQRAARAGDRTAGEGEGGAVMAAPTCLDCQPLPNRFAVGLCPLHAAALSMREALQTLVTALTAGEKWPVYLSDAIVDARAVLRDVEVPR